MIRVLPLLLFAVAAGVFPYAVQRVFLDTPIEASMGTAQKIFYFHVPLAWVFYLLCMISGGAAMVELLRNSPTARALAISAGELGVLAGLGVLITGPIWGHATWGRAWTNDARQVMTALIFLQFVAHMLIRQYGPSNSQRLAAGLAAFAVPMIPLNYYAVKIWKTTHPNTSVVGSLPDELWQSFYPALWAYLALTVALLWLRHGQELLAAQLDDLWIAADER